MSHCLGMSVYWTPTQLTVNAKTSITCTMSYHMWADIFQFTLGLASRSLVPRFYKHLGARLSVTVVESGICTCVCISLTRFVVPMQPPCAHVIFLPSIWCICRRRGASALLGKPEGAEGGLKVYVHAFPLIFPFSIVEQ